MIRFVTGDLFASGAQTLTNTVNCVGVMGKGVALEFRRHFPPMYEDYCRRARAGLVLPGQPYLYTESNPWVLNFPTKRHWRDKARLTDIEDGLRFLREHYREWGIESLALPPLGCGLGGLYWSQVKPLIQQHLGDLEIQVTVFEPVESGT